MIVNGRPGESHSELPSLVEEWQVGGLYDVTPWSCPICEQPIAQMAVEHVYQDSKTVSLHYSPRRWPEGDEDGLPLFAPTRRGMDGAKSERRTIVSLRSESMRRTLQQRESGTSGPPYDHGPIEERDFLLLCDNCAVKVRITSPLT